MTTYAPRINWYHPIAAHLADKLSIQPVEKTGRHEIRIACPQCGNKKKFSISERGANCFVCGYKPTLKALAERLGVNTDEVYTAPIAEPKPRPPREWEERPLAIARDLAETPGNVQAWRKYKPLKASTIHNALLGLGVFPGGLWDETRRRRCNHVRLIVPLFDGGQVVGFRCRAIDCGCTKWLSPGGSRMVLYGIDTAQPGCDVLVICENPIDKHLVKQEWEGEAAATLGVTIWKDDAEYRYTEQVRAVSPQQIVVWFDNDVPGQATNPRIIADWKAQRRARRLPDDEKKFLSGIKLTNRLLEAGLPATFYPWADDAPAGADIGSFFK